MPHVQPVADFRDIEKSLNEINQGAMDEMRMLELVTGVDENGRNFYAYMSIIPSKFFEYKSLLAEGEALDPEDFGEILEHGYGILPPVEVQYNMKRLGFQHTLERELMKVMDEMGLEKRG